MTETDKPNVDNILNYLKQLKSSATKNALLSILDPQIRQKLALNHDWVKWNESMRIKIKINLPYFRDSTIREVVTKSRELARAVQEQVEDKEISKQLCRLIEDGARDHLIAGYNILLGELKREKTELGI